MSPLSLDTQKVHQKKIQDQLKEIMDESDNENMDYKMLSNTFFNANPNLV